MRASIILVSLVGVTSSALLGCPGNGGGDGPPQQATDCPTDFPDDFPQTRQVDAGEWTDGDFVPYAAGQKVAILQGGQGLTMITPSIRVEAHPEDGEEACFRVRLQSDYQPNFHEAGPTSDPLLVNVRFLRKGDYLISDGALYNAFSNPASGLQGVDLKLTTTVQGGGFSGTKTVEVVLE